ncbi:putative linoleate 9S-lipoxygenase 5 [Dorcoceras hygrometricum]|uniref:Putative linoleate 9S-lipoxygenase 5 n=1 Tax=Dorcoceras hygrometricum TaxID=472368 RepID=A0A2Z7BJQ3_9LAMI|nr:putative linoleate 9S-lipoxygenase 5 [Dorcoceras hygrometricum]
MDQIRRCSSSIIERPSHSAECSYSGAKSPKEHTSQMIEECEEQLASIIITFLILANHRPQDWSINYGFGKRFPTSPTLLQSELPISGYREKYEGRVNSDKGFEGISSGSQEYDDIRLARKMANTWLCIT